MKTGSKHALDETLKIILEEKIKKNHNEGYLNDLGYAYLRKGMIDLAIQIFEKNVSYHPRSANPYDSLGE